MRMYMKTLVHILLLNTFRTTMAAEKSRVKITITKKKIVHIYLQRKNLVHLLYILKHIKLILLIINIRTKVFLL